jgi:mRNA-degrading endonuclease toxin of MazEF toxin-antitoxin module
VLSAWYPHRGEVCLAQLDKIRPVVVLSIDSLNKFALDVCVVPITSIEHKQFSVRVLIPAGEGSLDVNCWAKCDQVTTLEKADLKRAIGTLSEGTFAKIQEQVKICLGFVG